MKVEAALEKRKDDIISSHAAKDYETLKAMEDPYAKHEKDMKDSLMNDILVDQL